MSEVEAAQRRRQEQTADGRRLRAAVTAIDAAIEACEEVNLLGLTEPPPTLRRQVDRAMDAALEAVVAAGDLAAAEVVGTSVRRPARRVVVLMDSLWTAQDAVLDVLLPGRRVLPGHGDADLGAAAERLVA